jgi:hypothetical protein
MRGGLQGAGQKDRKTISAMRGTGRIFQRGEIWWVAYYANGKERRESSKSMNAKRTAVFE